MSWAKGVIRHLEETVAAVFLGIMVIVVAVDVFGRYVLNNPLQGAGEAARLLFVWQVFLASAGALRRGLHVGIDFIVDRFPPRLRALVDLVINAVVLVMLLVVGWMGFDLALGSVTERFQMLDLPYTYALMGIPAGCLLMVVHLVANIAAAARGVAANNYQPQRLGFAGTGAIMPEDGAPAAE